MTLQLSPLLYCYQTRCKGRIVKCRKPAWVNKEGVLVAFDEHVVAGQKYAASYDWVPHTQPMDVLRVRYDRSHADKAGPK